MNAVNLKNIFSIVMVILLIACSRERVVKEHFKNHRLSYPVDSSGLGIWEIEYVGIEEYELSAPGAREFVEEGILYATEYFGKKKIHRFISGATAVVLNKPVLYKDEKGDVGIMVKVTAFGAGKPGAIVKGTFRWIGSDRKLWSVENFAYFSQNDLYRWEYKGMVYEN
jgi:hypothetical protein